MEALSIICGPAGAGKSTYGKKLAAELGAAFLDSDTVTEAVVRAGMALGGHDPDDRDSPIYRKAFRNAVYQCLFNTAAENLPHTPVVMVGPFTSEIRRAEWLGELEGQFGCPIEVIFVSCDEEERYRRIVARENPRDELKLKNWQSYLAATDLRAPAFPHRVVRAC